MSSTSPQVALLPPLGRHQTAPQLRVASRRERPLICLATFAALAAYGVERWATLERGAPTSRLLGLLALALVLVGAGPVLRRRSRTLAAALAAVAVLAMFPLAGVPLAWVIHVRIAVTATAIGEGLSALPGVLVPYTGVDEWVRLVIALGAGVLLIDAALMLALAPRDHGDLRRAGAALPLVALAAIPSTIVHPQLPYLQGVILFALVAAFMWGERLERRRLAGAIAVCGAAAAVAIVVAPALETHKPWLDYQALARRLAAVKSEAFNWSQGYGPLNWPRVGRPVLEVRAARPDYWKAENLDLFAGRGWALGSVPGTGDATGTVARSSLARWTQTIQVTLRGMTTTQVIAAGSAGPPTELSTSFFAGQSPGTWATAAQLGSGASYSIRTYSPRPSGSQLATAGTRYPAALLPGFLAVGLGQNEGVAFTPFGSSRAAAYGQTSADPGPILRSSPYSAAYALALRLRRGATTPYAYVQAVLRYLAHGYSYNESPAPSAYPIETFLFHTRAGYCQQFAGAMALLLRMGGVPARVSVGFTSGSYDTATRRWVVSDLDAHAWVEAWFPSYGWVRFDPTPAAAPARGGRSPISGSSGTGSPKTPNAPTKHQHGGPATAGGAPRSASSGSGGGVGSVELGIAALVLAVILVAGALATRPLNGDEAELAELERAFARSGRPLEAGVTLSALERRLSAAPAAASYVRVLRLARFGPGAEGPTPGQRRALRAQLRMGLGPIGRLRALWALPPRRPRREPAPGGRARPA
jgi:transglutaminase-like putative cysteine protease